MIDRITSLFTNPGYFVVFFTIYTLASYRLVSLFSAEDGPKKVFHHLRVLAGVNMDANGQKLDEQPRGSVAYGLTCPWCCSVWVCVLVFAFYLALGPIALAPLVPLAGSTVAIKLDKIVNEYVNGKRVELLALQIEALRREQVEVTSTGLPKYVETAITPDPLDGWEPTYWNLGGLEEKR